MMMLMKPTTVRSSINKIPLVLFRRGAGKNEYSRRRCFSTTIIRLSEVASAGGSDTGKKEYYDKTDATPVYYVPKAERGSRSAFELDENLTGGETRLYRSGRLCPTRELNFTPVQWAKHKSPYRHLRHISNTFKSAPVQRLMFPDLFSIASIAIGVTYYNEFVACNETVATMSMSSTGFAGATTAIGLLAAFRLNACYGRYEECRIFWGDTNNTIRDLARQTMMWMKDEDQRSRMLKLCKAYPVTLMFHLNSKGCHHSMKNATPVLPSFQDRVQTEFQSELRDVYSDGKNEADFQRLSEVKYKGGNTPLEVLTCMGETIAGSIDTVDSIYVRELDEQCQRLCGAFGASERVLRTPLPTGFTRHSSRLLTIWSSTLPFALYPAMGPWLTLPTVLLTSYAVLGIEDIGVQLEEPFDILPLRQYSDGMFDSISAIEKNYTQYVIGEGEEKKEN
mmetsp:Transcript_14451/g.23907  ORF Transcript_14451/g.23907 Transcript_14451/m.23907 type:complete len:450 (+) Transcript_14451:123-1472(+)